MDIWYYGLADANGIESFQEDIDPMAAEVFFDKDERKKVQNYQFAMALRAQANQQRHAVVYKALVEDKDGDAIDALVKAGEVAEALVMLKEKSKSVLFATHGTTLAASKKNWRLIPNPDLDPYNGKD
jgi:hypothetical protein